MSNHLHPIHLRMEADKAYLWYAHGIFLTTMMLPGKEEEAFKVFFEQPAWADLKAVQTGRVYFLPQNLFLSSPGIHYPEALEIMANLAYEGDLE